MRPIAIFRFSLTEGPAYFAEWLDAHGLAWQLIALDAGASVPTDPRAFAGIGMMGGPMSVNDGLAWTAPLGVLLRDPGSDSEIIARVKVPKELLGRFLPVGDDGAVVLGAGQLVEARAVRPAGQRDEVGQ